MSAQIISGKAISESMLASIKARIDERLNGGKRTPALAVVLVGSDPASSIYVRNKRLACEKVGIRSVAYDLPASTSEKELFDLIDQLNKDDSIDGILVQSPLPPQIDEKLVISISAQVRMSMVSIRTTLVAWPCVSQLCVHALRLA